MSIDLTFHGAAGTVTGSCYRITHPGGSFIVDCGMFQGNRSIRELNWKPFPFDPAAVDYTILTHAHIDHSGLVPKLVKHGFTGPIWTTKATRDLLHFMLPDSASIQESNAERINRKHARTNRPKIEPTYKMEDAEDALEQMRVHAYDSWFEPGKGVRARYWNAGHILGSASVELEIANGNDRPIRILFSGDLGPDEKVFYTEPESPDRLDYVLCESTYGGRDRADATLKERRKALRAEIVRAMERGGNLIIPAFAVERTQELLHDIDAIYHEEGLPPMRIFLDSPLARRVTRTFIKHAHTLEDIEVPADQLFQADHFHMTESVEDSKALNRLEGGAIIMSASGMCDAGRIKHHLKNNLWRREATVLFVGYQAPGTLGHIIKSGAKRVRIHGREIDINASIREIGNYSAHADQGELVDWILERRPAQSGVFLTHGEEEQRAALREKLIERGLDADKVMLPDLDETFTLTPQQATGRRAPERRIATEDVERDWMNAYAEFTLALGKKLTAMEDAEKRRRLIETLQAAVGAE